MCSRIDESTLDDANKLSCPIYMVCSVLLTFSIRTRSPFDRVLRAKIVGMSWDGLCIWSHLFLNLMIPMVRGSRALDVHMAWISDIACSMLINPDSGWSWIQTDSNIMIVVPVIVSAGSEVMSLCGLSAENAVNSNRQHRTSMLQKKKGTLYQLVEANKIEQMKNCHSRSPRPAPLNHHHDNKIYIYHIQNILKISLEYFLMTEFPRLETA